NVLGISPRGGNGRNDQRPHRGPHREAGVSVAPRQCRCLVVADGFYERVGSDGRRHPIHFRLADGSLFGFAGLWTSRRSDEGEVIESCAIITTRPKELIAPVHARMPVIPPRDLEHAWLAPALPKEHALALLEPYPAGWMAATPASDWVNSVRNDDPGLLTART